MGIKSVCKFFIQSLFLFSVLALVILLVPNIPPNVPIQESYKLAPNRPLEGKLAVNERLNKAELWHNGDLIGAESFADYNGELYSGLYTGEIVKFTGQHITKIVKTGQPCRGAFEERICGRPLGMEFDKNGALFVADAYYGIMKVDVKTGRKEVLVSPDQKIGGKQPKLFNGLTLANNGDIFWTDSSVNFHLEDGIFDSLADPSGRLIHYNAKTKQNTVLMDKIAFANGILLTPDESAVFVSESFKNRILRYHLKGAKKGQHDVLVDGLPGIPDNLQHDGTGNGFLVTFVMPVDDEHPAFYRMLAPFPKIRKFLARLMGLNQMMFEMIDRFYPNDFSLKAIHFIGHFTSLGPLQATHRSTIIHIANNGEILDSVHATKHIQFSSEAYIFKDTLYVGSPFKEYIGRVKLADIGWQHLIQKVPSSSAPPRQETTTQKPTTTTTPRPATTTGAPTPKQTQPTQKPTTAPPPVKKQAPPPVQKQTPPPAQKQTAPPTKHQSPPPSQKQAPPPPAQKQQAPPPSQKQTPPPAAQKQTSPPPAQKQPPAAKQTPPPQQQQQKQAPPAAQKQTPPPSAQKQTAPPAQKQTTPPPAPKQTPPPPQQQPKQAPPPTPKQAPPPAQKQTTPPPPRQQTNEQPAAAAKPVPVKETVKTK